MPVNKEELAKDLETPDYQNLVKDTLSKKDFIVRTKDEETQFQERFKTDVIEKEIPSKISAVHSQYDKDVEAVTGVKRNQDEKSYEYVKRVLGDLKSQSSDELKKEVQDLKKQIAEGDKTGATAKALQEAEEKYKTSLAEKDNLIKSLQEKQSGVERESILTREYAEIKRTFKKDLPPLFDRTEKAILADVLSTAVIVEGKMYVGDGNGGVKKDASFNPIPISAKLKEEFKAVIDGAAPKGGGGTKGGGSNNDADPSKITVDNFEMPETVKNGTELIDYMMEQGLKRGTKQFDEIYAKFRVQLPDGKKFAK